MNWNISTIPAGTYYVRGLVVDDTGNKVEAYSAGTITVGLDATYNAYNAIFFDCYPGVGAPSVDDDVDGLTNIEEQGYGTDPGNDDTDGGHVIDGVEVAKGADPLNGTDDLNTTVDQYGWFYNFSPGFNTRFVITNYDNAPCMLDINTYEYTATAAREGHYKAQVPANGNYELDMSTLTGITDRGCIDVRSTTPNIAGIQHYTKLNGTDPLTWDWMHMTEMHDVSMFNSTLMIPFFNTRQLTGNHFTTFVTLKNPTNTNTTAVFTIYNLTGGASVTTRNFAVQAHRSAALSLNTVTNIPEVGYAYVTATQPLQGMENFYQQDDADLNTFLFSNALTHEPGSDVATTLYLEYYNKVGGLGGNNPLVFIHNPGTVDANVTLTAYNSDGSAGGSRGPVLVPAKNTKVLTPATYGTITAPYGSIVVTSTEPVYGFTSLQYLNDTDASVVDMTKVTNLKARTGSKLVCADFNKTTDFKTWIYVTNFSDSAVTAYVDIYDTSGNLNSSATLNLAAHACQTLDLSDPTYNVTVDRGSIQVTEATGSIMATMCQSRNNPAASTVKPGVRDAGEAIFMKFAQ